MVGGFATAAAATLRAVFDVLPVALPFFAPREGQTAADADFGGQVGFFTHFVLDKFGVALYISPKLGLTFTQAVQEAIKQAVMFPHAWAPLTPEIRRVLIHKFPYGLLYQQLEEQIVILAVMNLNRKPDYWYNRIE